MNFIHIYILIYRVLHIGILHSNHNILGYVLIVLFNNFKGTNPDQKMIIVIIVYI